MTRLIAFPLQAGGNVVVQVDETESGPVPAASPGDVAARALMTFEDATAKLQPIAQAVLAGVKALHPHEVTVELLLTFSAEAGVILAKTTGTGSCKVTLKWKDDKG